MCELKMLHFSKGVKTAHQIVNRLHTEAQTFNRSNNMGKKWKERILIKYIYICY